MDEMGNLEAFTGIEKNNLLPVFRKQHPTPQKNVAMRAHIGSHKRMLKQTDDNSSSPDQRQFHSQFHSHSQSVTVFITEINNTSPQAATFR